jgi:hypothetical protein
VSAELMINRRLLGENDLDGLRTRFGPHVSNVQEAWLPFDLCFDGRPPYTARLRARNALARLMHGRLLRQLAAGRYDFIHLNSLVLHPLNDESLPFILHVREVYDGSTAKVFDAARRARAVIFIDEATCRPFREAGVRGTIINNPFDMREVDAASGERLRREWQACGKAVFALIGKLNDNKGAQFVVEAFVRAGNPRAVLVLVGEGDARYVERCRALAAGADNVVFHGLESDIDRVYAASDYVLRGEEYACIGRTIYEGLYAGCSVVVPGSLEEWDGMFEADRFRGRVHVYAPRSIADLGRLFRTLQRPERRIDGSRSNVEAYIARFDRVLEEALRTKQ